MRRGCEPFTGRIWVFLSRDCLKPVSGNTIGRMVDYTLPISQLADLRAHRQTRDKRQPDRIKAVVLLASGWAAEDAAAALSVDPDAVRDHYKRYWTPRISGRVNSAYRASSRELTEAELAERDGHVPSQLYLTSNHLYLTSKEVSASVEETYHVSDAASGVKALLHRLGFVYKKPNLVAGKTDAAPGSVPRRAQRADEQQ